MTEGKSKQEMLEKSDPEPQLVALGKRLNEAQNEIKRLKDRVGTDERLFELIQSSIPQLPVYEPQPITIAERPITELQPSIVVCDAHADEVVDAEELEGMAAYSPEVFEARMELLAKKVLQLTDIMRMNHEIHTLHVWSLGDWFMGEIHPDESSWGSSMPLPMALPWVSRVFSKFLLQLSAHFEEVRVVGMAGNHGRNTNKPVSKMTADRNWDTSMHYIAKEMTADDARIQWDIPRSKVRVVDVLGWRNALTHGDMCRRTHSIPYFGIISAVNKEIRTRHRTTESFDFMQMGHWHHWGILEGETVINPPLVGHSQYAQYGLHQRSLAQQMMTFWSKGQGRASVWPINLEDVTEIRGRELLESE